MLSRQALTFLFVAFFISWSLIFDGYYGGFIHGDASFAILALAMLGPSLSALFCRYLFKQSSSPLQLRLNFTPTLWWLSAWMVPVLLILSSTALTLVFSQTAKLQLNLHGTEIGPSLFLQALLLAPLINMPLITLSEELGWRGYLYQLWRPFGFWQSSLATGVVWGLWHAPAVFFYRLNYPEYPVIGIILFTLWCMLISPLLTLIRDKTGSVWAAGLFHGTLNSLGALSLMLIGTPAFPWNGILGVCGFFVLALSLFAVKKTEFKKMAFEPGMED